MLWLTVIFSARTYLGWRTNPAYLLGRRILGMLYSPKIVTSVFILEVSPMSRQSTIDPSADKSLEEARKALHVAERFSLKTPLQFIFVSGIILWGWLIKEEEVLTAESGLGYALGIIGGSMMLVLLLYPLRKKIMVGRYLGSVPFWFKLHMFLGIFGPIAVLYHANFSLGSFNSSVALWCMVIVASSGLVGRYFYSKIHYGLYGRKASLDELNKIIDSDESQLATVYKLMPGVTERLKKYHAEAHKDVGFAGSLFRFFYLGFRVRLASAWLPFKLSSVVNAYADEAGWNEEQRKKSYQVLKKHLKNYLGAIVRSCEFSIYERLFGLWHVLHYPLFLMMVISGIVHVFAVHMY